MPGARKTEQPKSS